MSCWFYNLLQSQFNRQEFTCHGIWHEETRAVRPHRRHHVSHVLALKKSLPGGLLGGQGQPAKPVVLVVPVVLPVLANVVSHRQVGLRHQHHHHPVETEMYKVLVAILPRVLRKQFKAIVLWILSTWLLRWLQRRYSRPSVCCIILLLLILIIGFYHLLNDSGIEDSSDVENDPNLALSSMGALITTTANGIACTSKARVNDPMVIISVTSQNSSPPAHALVLSNMFPWIIGSTCNSGGCFLLSKLRRFYRDAFGAGLCNWCDLWAHSQRGTSWKAY